MRGFNFHPLRARQRREELGLTARQVADLMGVSESVICAYERPHDPREPGASKYLRLCQVLRVDDNYLREPVKPAA